MCTNPLIRYQPSVERAGRGALHRLAKQREGSGQVLNCFSELKTSIYRRGLFRFISFHWQPIHKNGCDDVQPRYLAGGTHRDNSTTPTGAGKRLLLFSFCGPSLARRSVRSVKGKVRRPPQRHRRSPQLELPMQITAVGYCGCRN